MKATNIWLHVLLSAFCLTMNAQVQQGFVRTIGRPGKKGVAVENVTIRFRGMTNAVLTSRDGEFRMLFPEKREGDPIVLIGVYKNGYELRDKELLGRQLVFSSKVPLQIMVVDLEQLAEDKRRIEENAYRVAESNFQKKCEELEREKEANRISAEQFFLEKEELQEKYERYLSLIGDMADRYARTDYDQLDSTDYKINQCIENGDLDKADSLIHSVFDPLTVLDRNRAAKEEIQQRILFAQRVIDKAEADRDAILRDMEYAEHITELCDNLADEYLVQGDTLHAFGCLEKSLEMKKIIYGEENEHTLKTTQKMEEIKKCVYIE